MLINEELPLKTNSRLYQAGIFDIPIFHHSNISCMRQKRHASINYFNFKMLHEFLDVFYGIT